MIRLERLERLAAAAFKLGALISAALLLLLVPAQGETAADMEVVKVEAL